MVGYRLIWIPARNPNIFLFTLRNKFYFINEKPLKKFVAWRSYSTDCCKKGTEEYLSVRIRKIASFQVITFAMNDNIKP